MTFANRITLICLFVLIAGVLCPASVFSMTVHEEEELGKEFMKLIHKHYKLIRDPLLVGYVEKIGKRILSVMPPQPFPYHFYVVDEDVYNAFAGPGGNIFINSGLFEAMDSEEELAGIISHEISHGICRHVAEKIVRQKKIGIATLAGLLAGVFLGAAGSPAIAEAVTMGSMAAGQSISLAYSREDEVQADQLGLRYLIAAGYRGEGMVTMLEKIRSKQWFGSDQIPTYLNTHPASEQRIVYIQNWLDSRSETIRKLPQTNPAEFERVHTRFFALNGPEREVLRRYEAKLLENPKSPMAHYGYGLALYRAGKSKLAADHLNTALKRRAFDPIILKDLGIIYYLDGRYTEALSALEGSLSIMPDDPEAIFYMGRTMMELGRLSDAATQFKSVIKHPGYTRALYFLGKAYGKLGRLGDAHYYLGVYYKRKGQQRNALFHLKKAQKEITDPEKQSEIKNMLKELGSIARTP
jgi:predicted Zn-dependent protease